MSINILSSFIKFSKILFNLLGSILATLTLKNLVPLHVLNPHENLNGRGSDLLSNSSNVAEKSLVQELNPSIGVTLLNEKITPMQGLTVEAIITFILIFTIFACIDSKRKDLGGSFPLSIGLALVVGALFGVIFFSIIFKNYSGKILDIHSIFKKIAHFRCFWLKKSSNLV